MLTTIKGVYDHGKIILSEEPPVKQIRSDVIITFLPQAKNSSTLRRILGGLENKISVPDDFIMNRWLVILHFKIVPQIAQIIAECLY